MWLRVILPSRMSRAATNLAVLRGDGEAEALGREDDGGVDADDFAAGVDERAAGVAGVEGGVGLDDVVDEPAGGAAEGSAHGADDAGGDGGLEAVGIADGDHELADLQG